MPSTSWSRACPGALRWWQSHRARCSRRSPVPAWPIPQCAALGSVASVIAALGYRRLTLQNLWRSLDQTMRVSVMLFFIIAVSITFAQILGFSGATGGMLQLVTSWKLGPYEIMFAMIAMLL